MTDATKYLLIMTAIILLGVLSFEGCATSPLTPSDNQRMEDEFRRAHENPIPPGYLLPRRPNA